MPRFAPPAGTPYPQYKSRQTGRAAARRVDEHDEVSPGMVAFTRGPGTYGARLRLKALGGRWNPDVLGGSWLIPAEHADAAEANIRLAERTGQELPLDDPKEDKVTCYVCGKKYTEFEMRAMKFAVAQDWYCGCSERAAAGPPPRTAQIRQR